jgi:hypothetical protein
MSGKVTLKQVESEARAVFGERFKMLTDTLYPCSLHVRLTHGQTLSFEARSRMAARRMALDTLRVMVGKD